MNERKKMHREFDTCKTLRPFQIRSQSTASNTFRELREI